MKFTMKIKLKDGILSFMNQEVVFGPGIMFVGNNHFVYLQDIQKLKVKEGNSVAEYTIESFLDKYNPEHKARILGYWN